MSRLVENNDAANTKRTNNKSSLGNGNNAKQNDVNNDNNIDYNPSYNNDIRLVKYDCTDAVGIEYITKTNLDNNNKTNGHNKQETIKIRTNNHYEW